MATQANARLNVLGSNEELRRFIAEVLELEAKAYSIYIKDGVMAPREVRTEMRQNTEQFKDLDPELPEDAVRSAQTTPSLPQPSQEPAEPQ